MLAAENGCREWSYHVREMGLWPDKARFHYVYKHGLWKEVWSFVANMKIEIQRHHHKTSTIIKNFEFTMESGQSLLNIIFTENIVSALPGE